MERGLQVDVLRWNLIKAGRIDCFHQIEDFQDFFKTTEKKSRM